MTLEELKGKCISTTLHYHHSASERGYIRSKAEPRIYPYEGRFGRGFTVSYPNVKGLLNGAVSNTYHRIEYYVY